MTTSSPGAAIFARLQNQQQGLDWAAQQRQAARDFEAQMREQARAYTAANRFRALAEAKAEYAMQTRLARLNSQTR